MKKNKLWLDDFRDPPGDDWVLVTNYDEFCDFIEKNGIPDFVSFDHDLADQHYSDYLENNEVNYNSYSEKTGFDCAKFLVEKCIKLKQSFPNYNVHSMNVIGKENIIKYVENFKEHVN